MGYSKPHSAPFLRAIELSNVKYSSNIVHVGDSFDADIKGAKEIGMRTIWVNNKLNDVDFLNKYSNNSVSSGINMRYYDDIADCIVSDIREVPKIIKEWNEEM